MLVDNRMMNDIRKKISDSDLFSKTEKKRLRDILDGKALLPLTSDTMAKRLFSPDTHPERFNYIMQKVMGDPTIDVSHSAANEFPGGFKDAKSCIVDLPAWLKDNRLVNLEIQAAAQEFAYNRFDLYSSNMLLLQYSVEEGEAKSDRDYENLNEVILVALMRDSPAFLKEAETDRYIHKFTDIVSDTGIKTSLLRKIAFVQLDKALEQFLSKTYNEDEDLEFLLELSMFADLNNSEVKEAAMEYGSLSTVYLDAIRFSDDKNVQMQYICERFAIEDERFNRNVAKRKGLKEGEARMNSLYAWLHENNRDSDLFRAVSDSDYREKLLKEYNAAHGISETNED